MVLYEPLKRKCVILKCIFLGEADYKTDLILGQNYVHRIITSVAADLSVMMSMMPFITCMLVLV